MRKPEKLPSPLFVPEGQHDRICIMAPGPSLAHFQYQMVKEAGLMTIAVGDAFRIAPDADILYHCDERWWKYYNGVPEFKGKHKVAFEQTYIPDVHYLLRSPNRTGVDLTPSTICIGNNSGYQAISLSLHYKPKQIILIGYDLKKQGKHYNCNGDHPKAIKGANDFKVFRHTIGLLAKPLAEMGITVYNCTISTDLKCFEQRELKDVL